MTNFWHSFFVKDNHFVVTFFKSSIVLVSSNFIGQTFLENIWPQIFPKLLMLKKNKILESQLKVEKFYSGK